MRWTSKRSTTGSATDVVRVERLEGNPIIRPAMLPGCDGENINGPSMIRAPEWLKSRLGSYYLYFAHHRGAYIRLAYAETPVGPWTVYEPGTLRLQDGCDCLGNPTNGKEVHVASPDVHVDDRRREIRMYFHGRVRVKDIAGGRDKFRQLSFLATSEDGIHFRVLPEPLGNSYFRVFTWNGAHYALAMPGVMYRSVDGGHRFSGSDAVHSGYATRRREGRRPHPSRVLLRGRREPGTDPALGHRPRPPLGGVGGERAGRHSRA